MDKNANSLNWFEIPVTDMDRATKFYATIMNAEMFPMPAMMGMELVGFPSEPGNGKASGALCKSDFHKPSQDGSLIYLNANPSIQTVIDKVETAGGKLIMPKTQISPEIGYMAFFIDTEGNRVGLHGQQ
jgi:predicted enzyme related to lactoylglutathione lyase